MPLGLQLVPSTVSLMRLAQLAVSGRSLRHDHVEEVYGAEAEGIVHSVLAVPGVRSLMD